MLSQVLRRAIARGFGRSSLGLLGVLVLVLGGVGRSGGDLIGTLPVVYGIALPPGAVEDTWELDSAFALRGLAGDLYDVVEATDGAGWVHAQAISGTDQWLWTFHGDVTARLDRALVEERAVRASYRVGLDERSGVGYIGRHGSYSGPFPLETPQFAVPAAELLRLGYLEGGAVSLELINDELEWTHFELRLDSAGRLLVSSSVL